MLRIIKPYKITRIFINSDGSFVYRLQQRKKWLCFTYWSWLAATSKVSVYKKWCKYYKGRYELFYE